MTETKSAAPYGAIGTWLLFCCAMVFAMVLLGGITRLTESGLSIVHWRPFTGWIPPMTDKEWAALFDAYRSSPEFRQLNFWMTIVDFKQIFWLEFLHRLLGRLVGVVFALPFLWFVIRHRLPWTLVLRLGFFLLLGGAQGLLGWYMVKSGLIDRPSVSQYRLAAHLLLAVLIYGLMLYTALGLKGFDRQASPRVRRPAVLVTAMVFTTMMWGALLAGIDGGAVFNTFPLMDGHVIPPDVMVMTPWWMNAVDNVALVQWLHRVLAMSTVAVAIFVWIRYRYYAPSGVLGVMALAALLQLSLGITTILTGAEIYIAWAHQCGALLFFTSAVWAWREAT